MRTIFVSSTFKDMHFERDAIQEITLPALKREAFQYGENLSFCDLRWGINTGDLDSEEGSRKVLDVCLDEIDRCKPPMVVILGDRYGWIPSETLTKSATERKKIELEDLQISVTALEIAYGALSTPERCRQTLFYFRHIESNCPSEYSVEDLEHEKKLNQLKAKIEELTEGRIRHYSVFWNGEKLEGVIPFAEMLAEDIKEVLLPEWKQKERLTPFERERLTHWSFIAEKNEMFSARESLVQEYYDSLTQNEKNFLAIKAPSGSGKSMLFSHLALKLRDGGYDVIPFMCGLTSESNDSLDILRNTIYYMEALLGFPHDAAGFVSGNGQVYHTDSQNRKNGMDALRERLSELCAACEKAAKRVVIMVDAADQLSSDENRDNLIFVPEHLSENVKFVMTCLPEFELVGKPAVCLMPITAGEKRDVIDGILRAHHRQIEKSVIEKMVEQTAADNPLYLSLLIQRLLMMNRDDFLAIKKAGDGMSAISKHQSDVIVTCPDSLQEMSALLLQEAGKRINQELVAEVAKYLAVSRHGLRQEDLAALLMDKWSALDFAHFITYMDDSFVQRDDGRFDFSHKCIREGFLYLCPSTKDLHKDLLQYLQTLPKEDSVRQQEIMYHCMHADQTEYFLDYIEENENREPSIAAAKKDAFAFSMEDQGEWLCGVMQCERPSVALCRFVNSSFLTGTPRQLAIAQKILHANILYAEANQEDFSVATSSLAYNQYAYVCGELGGKENLDLSLEYYHKAVVAAEEAANAYESVDLREFKAIRYSNYAHALKQFGDSEYYHQAILFYQKAIELREELWKELPHDVAVLLNLASSYDDIGGLFMGFVSGENQDKALVYLEKALAIRQSLLQKVSDDVYVESLIESYLSLARLHHNKASLISQKDTGKAIAYYHQTLALIESQKSTRTNTAQYIRLMSVLVSLGNLYVERMNGAYDAEKAKANFDRAIALYRAMDADFQTDSMHELYAFALNGCGLIILESKDNRQYEQAIEYFRESIAIIEELVESYQTSNLQTQLISLYNNCAVLCSDMNQEYWQQGVDYCMKALRLVKSIEDDNQMTSDYHKTCALLFGTISTLRRKQKQYSQSVKWFVRSIQYAVGQYSFKLDDSTFNEASMEFDKKKHNARDNDSIFGGVVSFFLSFATFSLSALGISFVPLFIIACFYTGAVSCLEVLRLRKKAKKISIKQKIVLACLAVSLCLLLASWIML